MRIIVECDESWAAASPEKHKIGKGSKLRVIEFLADRVRYADYWSRIGEAFTNSVCFVQEGIQS